MRRFLLLTLALAATMVPAVADPETCSETFVESPVVTAGPPSPDLFRSDPVIVCERPLAASTHTLITKWDPNSVAYLDIVVTQDDWTVVRLRCVVATPSNCGVDSEIRVSHWQSSTSVSRIEARTSTSFFLDTPGTVRMSVGRALVAGACPNYCALTWLRSGFVDLDIL